MKWSRTFIPTLKEDPQDAEAVSHKLMVRAGLIRRLAAGAYTYLPLGVRVMNKVSAIIRDEMEGAGAMEVLMPALQPVELWHKTGRYGLIGDVMIKYKDRHGKEMALGPTHEEIVTHLVAGEVRSYKDLPLSLYQIQTKFRDELRPRFGVIRSCEFVMKDAYSFDADISGMEESYKKMFDAYCRIFERCGLAYIAVEADSGVMGGAGSHEFMVPSVIGEDRVVICGDCGYAASTEVAGVTAAGKAAGQNGAGSDELAALVTVVTPGKTTVGEVSAFLKVSPETIVKTLIYLADEGPVAVLIRGDHEANETKIRNKLGAASIRLADEGRVSAVTGGAIGFAGPVGLKIPIFADLAVKNIVNAVTGSNVRDKHLMNVNSGRDFTVREWFDARDITPGDTCPKCGSDITTESAIEIGHTFKLGTKYSGVLGARFLDKNGKEQAMVMGCYGIGVNRIIASVIERSSDKNGIIWPVALAPYEIVIIPVNKDDKAVIEAAGALYSELISSGSDVIMDDRYDKSPGVKFKDADLVGFPLQVIVGKKNLDQGKIELKYRASGESILVDKKNVIAEAKRLLGKTQVR